VIDGEFWQIAGNPDLGKYTTPKQQPVDFAIWQAADGTWQLWSCIRLTACGGTGRLFHRWEGKDITDTNWTPMGIAMEAKTELGEGEGGLQAPHVVKVDDSYHMAYGDWQNICFATSKDGKNFERVIQPNGKTGVFSEGPGANTRDAMLIKIDSLWHCYYTAFPRMQGAIYCRTSPDLKTWGPSMVVNYGGLIGADIVWAECPHVVEVAPGEFVLFRNQFYGHNARNYSYYSRNPLLFGIDDDSRRVGTMPIAAPEIVHVGNQYYMACLLPELNGIQIAKLRWARRPFLGKPVLPLDSMDRKADWRMVEGDLGPFFTERWNVFCQSWTPFYISTAATDTEKRDDSRQGVLESKPFVVERPSYELMVSGSCDPEIGHVAIVETDSGKELARYVGRNNWGLEKDFWDASAVQGKQVHIRIVDKGQGPWAHVNFGGIFEVPEPTSYIE
ncbi:MAG: hypothetical protein K1Y02_23900, partial [Candidatus Hydrogenedentes bacterium]|nr:hypothetical protein [Candidatus Hydrogenedentota bacterium]